MDILSNLIIFLIRMKLHLRKGEQFQFDNQKTDSVYWTAKLERLLTFISCQILAGFGGRHGSKRKLRCHYCRYL